MYGEWIVIWLLLAAIGCIWGSYKGRPIVGLSLGFFLGVIGLIIFAFVKPTHEIQVQREAKKQTVSEEARRLRGQ